MLTNKTKTGVELRRLRGVHTTPKTREWVMVADRSRIRIFERKRNLEGTNDYPLIQLIESPQGRLKEHELVSDRPGRGFQSFSKARHGQSGTARHALASRVSPAEHELEILLRKATCFLSQAFRQRQYEKLEIFAEPHLMGKLQWLLNEDVAASIQRRETKDFAWLEGSALEARVQ